MQRWIWGLFILAVFVVPPRAVARETPMAAASPRVSASAVYIGLAEDASISVAIVMSGEGEARAYLCDGRGVNSWLLGSASAGSLALQAEDGATLTGRRATDRVSGTATLPSGEEIAFSADLASGVAGLYEAILDDDGRLAGSATDGRRIVGAITVVRARTGEVPVFAGLIETPDGTVRTVAAVVNGVGGSDVRLIVQADGSVVGSSRTGEKRFHPSNF